MKNLQFVLFSLLSFTCGAHSFCPPKHRLHQPSLTAGRLVSTFPRGGSDTAPLSSTTANENRQISTRLFSDLQVMDFVFSNLKSGPLGPLSLTAVIASVVIPLSLYKQAYSFSVGYGASVFFAAAVVFQQFSLAPTFDIIGNSLAMATMFYGARLSLFLLIRSMTMKSSYKSGNIKSKLSLALSVSPFYAFLTTPLLVAARVPVETSASTIGAIGMGLAWFGAILEATADIQKYVTKRQNPDAEDTFVGPTSGAYLLSRHPNYLGELLFWTGSFVAAIPSLGQGYSNWVCSILGLVGIYFVMTGATKSLEKKQTEKYAGQELYDEWTSKVQSPLFPFTKYPAIEKIKD